jgi:adenylyltransferase/sulfurtransferase
MPHSPETIRQFDAEATRRYSRQLQLPGFGVEGQSRLAAAKVLIIGAGGLGSPAALYLAAAGFGTIGIVEFDRVDISNLHRQVLYSSADVGRKKSDVARERILAANSQVSVECFETRLTSANALAIMKGFDVVIDASDNFPTRYLVNDAALILGIPCIYGSVHRFEGQLSVFGVEGGPCYRCLFRDPPPAGAVPNCAEAGVLGVLPGTIGLLQATEAIKIVTLIGEPMAGRLLLFDALAMSFRTIQLRPDPACPSCGISRTGTLIDYEQLCGASVDPSTEDVRVMLPVDLEERLARGDDIDLVDVRERYEWDTGRIAGARLVPLATLDRELDSFRRGREIVIYCRSGARSLQAARHLAFSGISNVSNLTGGIVRWREDVDAAMPVY